VDIARQAGPIIDGKTGDVLDAAALRRRIDRRKDALAADGLRAGDRVALAHGNSPDFFVDLAALWALGASAVPVDPSQAAPERDGVLRHSGARRLLAPGRDERLPGADGAAGESDEALVLYTSGTASRPKGVVHTFAGLAAKFAALSAVVDARAWNRVLCLLPTHFGHGLVCNSLWPWLTGRELAVFPSNDLGVLARLGETIDLHRADFFSTVPSIWRWILHTGVRPPEGGTLKRVHCASAPLEAPLWERAGAWAGGAPVVNVYGTTETAGWIAGTDAGERPEDGLVGRGWGCEFEARGARDGVGEIWARTDSLMRGYLGRPDLTSAVVRDGWYRTGDVGRVDADGRVRLKGRLDDMINTAGLKVHPDEVEEVLRGCDEVADVCVFGRPHPVLGEEVAAAVVLRGGDLPRVRAWCDGRLSPHKAPRQWFPLDRIPRNERGKVSRRQVAETCGR
jgi:acyl-CoA synthetase (AMP-forming)/AMP-acid ligase II